MKRPPVGRIHERITAIAPPSYPVYVVEGENKNLIIDSGVNLLGPTYLAGLADVFGENGRPDYLFLTHSHYDHLGSAGYLKRHLPGLRVGAHERVAALVQKPSALETMNRLSRSHAVPASRDGRDDGAEDGAVDDGGAGDDNNTAADNEACGSGTVCGSGTACGGDRPGDDITIRSFEIDLLLKEGDEIDLGGLTCRVYETPGHTRDSLAFYFPEIEALFPGDAVGIRRPAGGASVQVVFVASFEDYVQSIKRMIVLGPRMICLAHNWVLTDADAAEFLERSLTETFRFRELIERSLDAAAGDVEQAIEAVARVTYGGAGDLPQPSAAFMTNLVAQVKLVAGLRETSDGPSAPTGPGSRSATDRRDSAGKT